MGRGTHADRGSTPGLGVVRARRAACLAALLGSAVIAAAAGAQEYPLPPPAPPPAPAPPPPPPPAPPSAAPRPATPPKTGAGRTRTVHVRGFERIFRSGVLLRTYVARSGSIGKFANFRIRRHRAPRRTAASPASGCGP